MKTSTKLILAIAIVATVSLAIYDMLLRQAYVKGDYNNPYRDYASLDFKNFTAIDLDASTVANIIVKQGPFSIKIDPYSAGFVRVTQNKGILHIKAAFNRGYTNEMASYILIITCPKIDSITTDSRYMANGKQVTDSLASWDFMFRPSVISGFTEDSLSIVENHAGNLILSGNNIKSVKAAIGIGDKCRSNIIITDDNKFQNAHLDILNYSQLQLHNAHINNLKYLLADSAKLIQYGGTPNILKKQN